MNCSLLLYNNQLQPTDSNHYFDPALALQFIERGVVQLPFALQEQISAVRALFRRYENVPASLADAALIRLAEINDSPLLLAARPSR